MEKRMRERRVYADVPIIDIAEEGKGVAKVDNLVIFVPHAVPGDVADIELLRKKRNYAEGRISLLKQASHRRADPPCQHFGTCGGCKWQNMAYREQLVYKQQSVANALARIGKIDTSNMEEILPANRPYYYRNKL